MKEGAHPEVEGLTDRVFAVQEREGKERERQILRSLIKESGKREGERDHHKRLHAGPCLSLSFSMPNANKVIVRCSLLRSVGWVINMRMRKWGKGLTY